MQPFPHRQTAAGLAALVLLAACASERRTPAEELRWLVDHGRYAEALESASRDAAAHPDDPAAAERERYAKLAFLLEQGRRATFDDRDDDALAAFEAAVQLDPSSQQAQDWRAKTLLKLAETHFNRALELHASDDIEGAVAEYEKALATDPTLESAQNGRTIALLLLQYRAGLGNKYFEEGLHALSDYWLEQANSRFSYAVKYRKDDARTAERKKQVAGLLAAQRISTGRAFEEKRMFGAAHGEYRLAKMLDADNADAVAGLERCKVEMAVTEKLKQAGIEVTKGRFDKAADLTAQALAETTAQKDMCEGMQATIRDARFERAYREALALERDSRFADAAARYGELIAEAGFYKDAITRKDTLDEYVKRAADLYAQYEAASDPKQKLDLLRRIQIFWPEYKDVAERLRELEGTPGG